MNFVFSISVSDVSGISQRWNKLRRRCASFKAVSGPASLDADASYILTDNTVTQYSVVPSDRHQIAGSMTSSTAQHTPKHQQRPFSWRKSHSVEKYDYRDVNLNSSIPEKINKTIPLPEDYWKVHEQDVKLWKIGTSSTNRPISLRDLPRDGGEWEFNVQKYENMSDRRAANRIQYYTGNDANDNRKHSLESERKEIKFLNLKAFKSASMRLPGQKSSIQEVHQMLRNKFNRLNVGLRKKRTLSVQEVFPNQSSQQQTAEAKPQFYVPLPNKLYNDDDCAADSNGPSSLPYCINNNNDKKMSTTNGRTVDKASSSTSAKTSPSSPDKQTPKTRIKLNAPAAASKSVTVNAKKPNEQKEVNQKPRFAIGGRVSLREKSEKAPAVPSSSKPPSTASKITNAVRQRIRMRPRSHSPIKQSDSKSDLSSDPATEQSNRRKSRDSGGFLNRINRIMSVNHLPPPHSGTNNNNNNNNSINKMNRSLTKSNENGTKPTIAATHAVNSLAATPTTAMSATQKTPNNEESSESAVIKSYSNGNECNQTNEQRSQMPETIYVRDRKITSKQVCTHTKSINTHVQFRLLF